jgi:glycosyltransferase involved in cell wall biosynthesis
MPSSNPLVSVGLPVRNGAARIEEVVRRVLSQDHQNLELVISDNASSDETEKVCRGLASADPRIVYHRQAENVGLLNNFIATMRMATGEYFRWVGDDDYLAPNSLSRCLATFARDDRLILVTAQVAFVGEGGTVQTAAYDGTGLASDDPVERFAEMLRLLNESYLVLDPIGALMRRKVIVPIPRRNMLREDQIFASQMALAGPWGHVPDVLTRRVWRDERRPGLARRLGVPVWQAHFATLLQCRELLRHVATADLDGQQKRRARAAVARLYLGRHRNTLARRGRRVVRLAGRGR